MGTPPGRALGRGASTTYYAVFASLHYLHDRFYFQEKTASSIQDLSQAWLRFLAIIAGIVADKPWFLR